MYQQSTDSIRLFAERSSHSRMLFASPREYVYIEHSHRFCMPRSRSVRIAQNYRIWLSEKPQEYRETGLHPKKLGVWFAVSRRRIVGPIFF